MTQIEHLTSSNILVSRTITASNILAATVHNNRKNIMIANCAPFTNCISEINNTQIDKAKNIDVVIPMYNLIEYSNNYSKTSGSLWEYDRDEQVLKGNGTVIDFPSDNSNNFVLFKIKIKVASKIEYDSTKDVRTMAPVKYLSNFLENLLNVIY